jgi:hypothetical protein
MVVSMRGVDRMTKLDRWPADGICCGCGEEATVNSKGRCFDCFYEQRGIHTNNPYAEEGYALDEWEREE